MESLRTGHQAGEGLAQCLPCLGKGLLQGRWLMDTQPAACADLRSDTVTIFVFSEGSGWF